MTAAAVWREEELIDRLVNWIVRQGMVTPAVFLLEINKPFSFLGGQALWMLQPLLGSAVGHDLVAAYARLLENPTNIDRLLASLESCQAETEHPARTGGSVS